MKSNVTLYYNCLLNKEKNIRLDNRTSGSNAVGAYVNTLTKELIENYQYVKHGLSISIKINKNQTNLEMVISKDMNYVKIQNYDVVNENTVYEKAYYYFIVGKNWKSKDTIELVLSMDTLNTFQYDVDYEISNKTLVKRMHKDRFKKLTGSYSFLVFGTAGLDTTNTYTNVAIAGGTIKSMTATSVNPNFTVTLTEIVSNGKTYIQAVCHPNSSSFMVSLITINYEINGYLSIIDLKSEEINAPLYKISDYTLYDQNGEENNNWSLYYKTADNQESTPIDCYLMPSEPMKFNWQQNSGEFNNNNIPNNKYLMFFVDYNNPPITFNIDGVLYTPELTTNSIGIKTYTAIALYNDNGTIKVYYGNFIESAPGIPSGVGSWTEIANNPVNIHVENSPANVRSNEVASLPVAFDIFHDYLYISSKATHTTSMGALVETTLYGKNTIDKTLSTNVKIINIPYSPTPYTINSGILTFDSCWTYNSVDGKLKLTDFTKKFENVIKTDYPNIIGKYIKYINTSLSADTIRFIVDPKLLHSDYYQPKFVYDSFTKVFALEQVDYPSSNKDLNFNFNFIMTRNIVSKFLFKFDQIKYAYSKEDYDNILAVSRNNEEVLYNSQYLDYIRTGYNYDLKAKEKSEVASGIGMGLNIAGLVASIGIGALTGNPIALGSAVASGISLANQITNYAKNVAQNEENIQRKLQEKQMQAISVLNADDYDLLESYSNNKAKICEYEVSPRMKNVLDDLFFYCGYSVNEQMKPVVNSRRSFNFVQATLVINDSANLPVEIEDDIKEKFEQGVTFLHTSFNKWDFKQDKENIEISIL